MYINTHPPSKILEWTPIRIKAGVARAHTVSETVSLELDLIEGWSTFQLRPGLTLEI